MGLLVIQWYSDVIIISITLIVCIILAIITFIRMNKSETKMFPLFRMQVYAIFTSATLQQFDDVLRVALLPIVGGSGTTQQTICDITNSFGIFLYATTNLLIILLLINRLKKIFSNTQFTLSKCIYYSYICIFGTLWCIVMIIGAILVGGAHVKPTNIYTETSDDTGNGYTCTLTSQNEDKAAGGTFLPLVLGISIITLLFSNLFIWILFIRKLYIILSLTRAMTMNNDAHMDNKSEDLALQKEFIILMKEQTMLVGMIVFGTFFAYIFTIILPIGTLLININKINILLMIFVSFKFNRKYFELFACVKCSACCCKCFASMIVKKIGLTDDEENIATEIVDAKATKTIEIPSKQSVPTHTDNINNSCKIAKINGYEEEGTQQTTSSDLEKIKQQNKIFFERFKVES